MFRRVFSSASKGLPLAAAAVAIGDMKVYSNEELIKKPKWYMTNILKLEETVKQLSRYQPIESASFLHDALDILKRVDDVNNTEISWRLGRALVEEAEWIPANTKNIARKIGMLEQGIASLKKALSDPNSASCAAIYKWYAIALKRLLEINKKHQLVVNANEQIIQYLELSIKLDPKDPFTYMELASYYRQKKNYREAIKNSKSAEKLKPDFSNLNQFILGSSLYDDGQKEEGIKILKHTLAIKPISIHDKKGWFGAKTFLVNRAKMTLAEINQITWEY